MKDEWERNRRAIEDRKQQVEDDSSYLQREAESIEEERLRREEEEELWRQEYEARKSKLGLKRTKSQSSFASNQSLRPQLGVEIKMLDDSDGRKNCIVVVERVVAGGPADRAGINAEDIIDQWNATRLTSKAQWAEKVRMARIGQTVKLTIYRGSDRMEIPVTIAGTTREMGGTRIVASKNKISTNFRYDNPSSITSPGSRTKRASSAVRATSSSRGGSPFGGSPESTAKQASIISHNSGTMQYDRHPSNHSTPSQRSSRSSSVQMLQP